MKELNNLTVKYGLYPIHKDEIYVYKSIFHRLLGIKTKKIKQQYTETP